MKILLLFFVIIIIDNSKAYTPRRFDIFQHFDDVVKTQIPILALIPSLTTLTKAFRYSETEETDSIEDNNVYKRNAHDSPSQGFLEQFNFKEFFQPGNVGKTVTNIVSNRNHLRPKRRSHNVDINDWFRLFNELWRNPPNKIRRAFDECFRLIRQQHGFGILGGIMRNTADTVDVFNNFTQNINGKADENNRIAGTVSNAIRKLTDAMPGTATHDIYYNAFNVMPELLADFLNHPVVKNHVSKIYNSENYLKFETELKEFRNNLFKSGHQLVKRSEEPKSWFNWQQ